jgi:hypothetical protein
MRRAVLVLLASAVVAAPAAGAAPSHRVFTTRIAGDSQISSNWAGYAVTGTNASGAPMSFTDVTAS